MSFFRTCVRKVLKLHIFRVRRKFLRSSYIDSLFNLNSSRTTLVRTALGRRLGNPWTTLGRPSDDPRTTLRRLLDLGRPSDDPRTTHGRPSKYVSNDRSHHDDSFCPKIVKIGAILVHFWSLQSLTKFVTHKNFRTWARITGSS